MVVELLLVGRKGALLRWVEVVGSWALVGRMPRLEEVGSPGKEAVRLNGLGCTCFRTWPLVAIVVVVAVEPHEGSWGILNSYAFVACTLRLPLVVGLVAPEPLAPVVLVVSRAPLLVVVAGHQERASDFGS